MVLAREELKVELCLVKPSGGRVIAARVVVHRSGGGESVVERSTHGQVWGLGGWVCCCWASEMLNPKSSALDYAGCRGPPLLAFVFVNGEERRKQATAIVEC